MTIPGRRELLEVAVEAAGAAGTVLLERFEEAGLAVATKSTATDPVSEADLAAERAIRDVLAGRRPGDAILGEEGGDALGTTGLRWVVDPLDGTVNFLFGIPQWCVSVACEGHAGAILDPIRQELFTVVTGEGAWLGPEALQASGRRDLATALVATGFAYDAGVRAGQAQTLARVLPRVRDVRRLGSAALDLAWTAAGRYDAYYERGVQPWDVAAGRMLCAAAGLEVRDLPARDGLPAGVLVAPPALAGELLELVV
ncbi:MAG TPA: inositol monophosphatase family protein [Solirubrobacteraceae bacterium]|nr:inositol monophosphatase family protein [Solirubrobacteraceae bacterium]